MSLFTFQRAEFTKETYVFGRDPLCDYSFSNSTPAETNPHMQAFSKYHFRVHKVRCVCVCVCVWVWCTCVVQWRVIAYISLDGVYSETLRWWVLHGLISLHAMLLHSCCTYPPPCESDAGGEWRQCHGTSGRHQVKGGGKWVHSWQAVCHLMRPYT